MSFSYMPEGVCSEEIIISLAGDTIEEVEFVGGCEGNLKAVSRLVKGRSIEEVSSLLAGLTCNDRGTSCGDQLCRAIQAAKDHSA